MIAYLNLIHGDDSTAALDNPQRPFRSQAALQTAIKAWSDKQQAKDSNPETQNHRRAMLVIDQGDCLPSRFHC